MEQRRRDALLKEKWRKDIESQLQLKQERKAQEQHQNVPASVQPTHNQASLDNQKQRLEQYRNELLNQIKEQQSRKEREKAENEKVNESLTLLDCVEERTRKMKTHTQQRSKELQ